MITKAIIPVAGWGTRRLPITKVIEKCMLPIGNVPAIDFIIQDCIKAGITDFYFVVNGDGRQIKEYYSHHPELTEYLKKKGKNNLLPLIEPPKDIDFHFVTTEVNADKYGTTVPVWVCRGYIEAGEQFLVVMGDNVFDRTDGGSNAADLIRLVEKSGFRSGLLGTPVPLEDVEKYGVIEKDADDTYIRIVEHPKPEQAPSNLNNASFYLFDSQIFEYCERDLNTPHTGEYMIIDVINEYVAAGHPVKVGMAEGEYFDVGNLESWLKANQVIAARGGGDRPIRP